MRVTEDAMATNSWLVVPVTLLFGAAMGCGGHKSQAAAPSGGDDPGGGGEVSENPCGGDTGMCPPETLDRIKEALDAKRTVMSRCLSDAVVAGQADKGARGQVTVNFVIRPDGKATNVKVGKSTVGSKAVDECVTAKVAQISFPEVPKDLEWSYTYGFESN
jgi:TonB family protein